MLYKILNNLFKITQLFYFKKVEVEGMDKIPKKGANILLANHPSAFKDPILVGSNIGMPIFFLTAEEFMGGKYMVGLMAKQFNMIPIYRPSTRPDDLHKNLDSFKKCYEALAEHKSILIFGEGHSETQSWLDPLKTGAARIALEAVKTMPGLEEVNIVPIGLNYSNPHQFRSTFLLKVGETFTVTKNSVLDKNEITDKCYSKLNEVINGIDKEDAIWLDDILTILRPEWECGNDLKKEFSNKSRVIKLIYENDKLEEIKEEVNFLKLENDNYKELIKESMILLFPLKVNYLKIFVYLLIYLPGYLIHLLPLKLTSYFVRKKEFKYSFEGSMYFGFGTLFTLLWYILLVAGTSSFIGYFCFIIPFINIALWLPSLALKDYLDNVKKYVSIKNEYEDYTAIINRIKMIRILLKESLS